MTTITTRIVKIGNSQGIRIPRLLLDQVQFGQEVELVVQERQIVIREAKPARAGWAEAFQKMAKQGDDLLLDDVVSTTEWDEEEWEWE